MDKKSNLTYFEWGQTHSGVKTFFPLHSINLTLTSQARLTTNLSNMNCSSSLESIRLPRVLQCRNTTLAVLYVPTQYIQHIVLFREQKRAFVRTPLFYDELNDKQLNI